MLNFNFIVLFTFSALVEYCSNGLFRDWKSLRRSNRWCDKVYLYISYTDHYTYYPCALDIFDEKRNFNIKVP